MANIEKRERAQKLRLRGTSIADIAKEVVASKSTVSLWCRDIVLSDNALQNIIKKSKSKNTLSLLNYTEKLREKRQRSIKEDMSKGSSMVGNLSERDILCIGLGLYWGEGYKRGSQEFGFTNSDGNMIKFYIKWLKVVFAVNNIDLILRVSINESHKDRIKQVEKFWSKVTNVPLSQFTKPSLIKTASKKNYNKKEAHYGTLRIKVRRGTSKRRIVLGAIESLQT